MEWLNNPWVVGVGGGLSSGFIIGVISWHLFSRRERLEYLQRVASANREVIYAIRPGISEGFIPSRDIIQALIHSTARKSGVDLRDVYGPAEVAEDLIKEVMDTRFISATAKSEYCSRLSDLTQSGKSAFIDSRVNHSSAAIRDYRQRVVVMMSSMLGLITAMSTLGFALTLFKGQEASGRIEKLLPILLATVVSLLAMLIPLLYRTTKRRRVNAEPLNQESPRPVARYFHKRKPDEMNDYKNDPDVRQS